MISHHLWASIWNLRAVDEGEAFGIDHQQMYMGVLLQSGVDATAAVGVLVTRNLRDPSDVNGYHQRELRARRARIVRRSCTPWCRS